MIYIVTLKTQIGANITMKIGTVMAIQINPVRFNMISKIIHPITDPFVSPSYHQNGNAITAVTLK